MKKIAIIFVFAALIILNSCQTTPPLDPETAVALEINNIPTEYNGYYGLAGYTNSSTDVRCDGIVDFNILSGVFKHKNGDEWKVRDIKKYSRYWIILVLSKEGQPMITRFSKQIVIKSESIILDYGKDFYDTADEAVRRY